jgi:hypothetical protein
VNASVSDAAANTVTEPESFDEGVATADPGEVEPPQAASTKDRPSAAGVIGARVSKVIPC